MWEILATIIGESLMGTKEQAVNMMKVKHWARERGLWVDKSFYSLEDLFMTIQRNADQLLMEAAEQEAGY